MSEKHYIKIKSRDKFLVRGLELPGSIWQEPPFKFDPIDFAVGDHRLNEKIFDGEVQVRSLDRFIEEPNAPYTYGVASDPSDSRARYFAAFLTQKFLEANPHNTSVHWEFLYGNGFKNAALDLEPSLLVINGLSPNASTTKLEKARDLLQKHQNIPRIVVIAGEDPITFFMNRLYMPIQNIYFHSSKAVKRKVEIV